MSKTTTRSKLVRHALFPLVPCVLAAFVCDGSAQQAHVAFVNVNVVPMDSQRVIPRQNVLVSGDRIVAIGPAASLEIPQGAQRIEGDGTRYLIPGMAELHGHIPPPGESQAYIENVLFLFVANGVTTVRGMLGQEGQLELRRRASSGDILSPTLYLAGPPFDGRSTDSPEAAAERVRQQKREGWDYLKVLWGLAPAEYDAMAKTAHEVGIPFIGHVPREVSVRHALESGQQTIDHFDGYLEYLDGTTRPVNDERIAEVVKLTKESGAWVVPTMVVWENLFGDTPTETVRTYAGLQYLPQELVSNWIESHGRRLTNPQFDRVGTRHLVENRMRLLRAMHEGGVRILFGTDAPQQFSVPGFSIYREMQRMRQAGMTPYDILRTATSSAGEYFKDKDSFGMIAPGQRADLVLLNANPLETLENVSQQAGVMVRGRWLPEEEIKSRLEKIASSNGNASGR
jgi:imidazolonepropionase-like amidohydrolase